VTNILLLEPSSISVGDPEKPGISSLVSSFSTHWGIGIEEETDEDVLAGKKVLVPGGVFPDDLDTTALALQVLRPFLTKNVSSILDTMAEYVNEDGTFQVNNHACVARVTVTKGLRLNDTTDVF
jgi:hypothetical protein